MKRFYIYVYIQSLPTWVWKWGWEPAGPSHTDLKFSLVLQAFLHLFYGEKRMDTILLYDSLPNDYKTKDQMGKAWYNTLIFSFSGCTCIYNEHHTAVTKPCNTIIVVWPCNHVWSFQRKLCPASSCTTLGASWVWESSGQQGGSGKCSRLPHWVGRPRCDQWHSWPEIRDNTLSRSKINTQLAQRVWTLHFTYPSFLTYSR